jgi:hypothetical protein
MAMAAAVEINVMLGNDLSQVNESSGMRIWLEKRDHPSGVAHFLKTRELQCRIWPRSYPFPPADRPDLGLTVLLYRVIKRSRLKARQYNPEKKTAR